MTSKISVEAKKSEFMVSNAMDDVTRASKKALMDYLCKMYYVPLAKTIAYLELDDTEAEGLCNIWTRTPALKLLNAQKALLSMKNAFLKKCPTLWKAQACALMKISRL